MWGKRNLYLGWPAVCTLLGEEQCGQWTRGKRNLYLGWPAVCWLAQIYWVRNSAGSAQEEREISTWVDLVLLSAEFAMILVTSWKNNQIFAIRKNKTEKAPWCRGTQFSVRFPRLPSLLTVFRIRIHWVRIPIQHFRLNSEYCIHPDPGFSMTKRQKLKNLQLKKILIFCWNLFFLLLSVVPYSFLSKAKNLRKAKMLRKEMENHPKSCLWLPIALKMAENRVVLEFERGLRGICLDQTDEKS